MTLSKPIFRIVRDIAQCSKVSRHPASPMEMNPSSPVICFAIISTYTGKSTETRPGSIFAFSDKTSTTMAEKKQTTQTKLPLPTPVNDPGFVGESPSNEYVTVLTPDNKTLTPIGSGADFDPNGLRMNAWTVNLHDADLRTAYYWWVCCCPCAPLSQLETRLGLNSCGLGFSLDFIAYTGRFLFLILTLVNLFRGNVTSFVVFLALFVFCLIWVAQRVARVRMQVRERLDIAGSSKEDRIMGCVRSASAIRQMGVQLKCDQVHFGAPATLQAYQV